MTGFGGATPAGNPQAQAQPQQVQQAPVQQAPVQQAQLPLENQPAAVPPASSAAFDASLDDKLAALLQ
jgi:hypothetical protein